MKELASALKWIAVCGLLGWFSYLLYLEGLNKVMH
jgi:hypothetical protein